MARNIFAPIVVSEMRRCPIEQCLDSVHCLDGPAWIRRAKWTKALLVCCLVHLVRRQKEQNHLMSWSASIVIRRIGTKFNLSISRCRFDMSLLSRLDARRTICRTDEWGRKVVRWHRSITTRAKRRTKVQIELRNQIKAHFAQLAKST